MSSELASAARRTEKGLAVWDLHVKGADLAGRWLIIDASGESRVTWPRIESTPPAGADGLILDRTRHACRARRVGAPRGGPHRGARRLPIESSSVGSPRRARMLFSSAQ